MKKLIIVGNQTDLLTDYSEFINNAEYVIRFNKMESYNKNTGTKIDELVCRYANAYNIIHGFIINNEYINKDIELDKLKFTVVLNNFKDNKALEIANNICEKNNISNINIIYNNLNNTYNNKADTTLASTGKVIIEYILKDSLYKNYEIYIIGFNWFNFDHNNGHMWKLEREQITQYIKENKLIHLK